MVPTGSFSTIKRALPRPFQTLDHRHPLQISLLLPQAGSQFTSASKITIQKQDHNSNHLHIHDHIINEEGQPSETHRVVTLHSSVQNTITMEDINNIIDEAPRPSFAATRRPGMGPVDLGVGGSHECGAPKLCAVSQWICCVCGNKEKLGIEICGYCGHDTCWRNYGLMSCKLTNK
jgi:hypothetical protein